MKPAYASRLAGCHTTTPLDQGKPGECAWNEIAAGKPIYLVGDSNADHFSDAIIAAAAPLDRPVYTSTASACPFIDAPIVDGSRDASWNAECHAYFDGSLRHLLAAEKGTVIISTSDAYWWPGGAHLINGAADSESKLRALRVGLTSTVESLKGAGHSVLLVQSIPKWVGEDELVDCSLITLLTNTNNCSQAMPLDRALQRQGAVRAVVSEVAAATGSEILDTWSELCTKDSCESVTDGLTRYRDGSHITVKQSQALGDVFKTALTVAG